MESKAYFWHFFKDAGAFALTSWAAGALSLGLGTWEHNRHDSVSAPAFYVGAALLFLFGSLDAYRRKFVEAEQLKRERDVPQLYLAYQFNYREIDSCFYLRTEDGKISSNVKITCDEVDAKPFGNYTHPKLRLRWHTEGIRVGETMTPIIVGCVRFDPLSQSGIVYGGRESQIEQYFDCKKEPPAEVIATLSYTDMAGNLCPKRQYRIWQDAPSSKTIYCEPFIKAG